MAARRWARALVDTLTDEEKARESAIIVSQLITHVYSREPRVIMLFAALPWEPNIDSLRGLLPNLTFAYPRVVGAGEMRCHAITSSSDLERGAFGLQEPKETCPTLAPHELDLVVVPGWAFTSDGARLGKGGGYYDRLLADVQGEGATIGVCFQCQLWDTVPIEDHDRAMDVVLTGSQNASEANGVVD